MNCRTGIMASR